MRFPVKASLAIGVYSGLYCPVQAIVTFNTLVEATKDVTAISHTLADLIDHPDVPTLATGIPALVGESAELAFDVGRDLVSAPGPIVPLNETQQIDACNTFKEFAKAEVDLFTSVGVRIAEASTIWIPLSPLAWPIFSSIGESVDSIAAGFIDIAPVCVSDIRAGNGEVHGAIDACQPTKRA